MDLMEEVERIAKERYDGHLSIFRFTTGWKAVFGTAMFSIRRAKRDDGARMVNLYTFPTLDEALKNLLDREQRGLGSLEKISPRIIG